MNRLERFYKIHDVLKSAHRPVPMRTFMEQLDASRNTVTRDFEYMKLHFNAPIIYDRARNGHLYDPAAPVFELPGLWLNASELHALLACEQWLANVQPGLLGSRLSPLRQRIRKLLADSGQGDENVAERIRVQPVYHRTVSDHIFMPVADATLTRRQLGFSYHSRGKDENTERHVSPQQLMNYRNNWYLLGLCHRADDLRLFSLDRIQNVRIDESPAQEVPQGRLDDFVRHGFGIFSGPSLKTAHLKFSHQAARWAAEENWHPDQQGQWLEDRYELHVPYANPTELIMDILRYGPDVEVLGPPELRRAIGEKIRQMHEMY